MARIFREDLEKIGAVRFQQDSVHWLNMGIVPRVKTDSRKIIGGDIFIALLGEKEDGHTYVISAFKKGAAICIVSKEWFEKNNHEINEYQKEIRYVNSGFLVVQDTLVAMQDLARIYREKFEIPIVAIGGNSGKTTTKEMLAFLFGVKYKVVATEKNYNNHIGVPLTLFNLRSSTEIAIIEMGMNHSGEVTTLCNIARPTHGLITNIGHAHIEFFKSIEEVATSEGELFAYLSKTNGTVFVNMDDEYVVKQSQYNLNKYFYGTKNIATSLHAKATNIQNLNNGLGVSFDLCIETKSIPITLQLPGRHNGFNALVVACVAHTFKYDLEEIKYALEKFEIDPTLKRSSVFLLRDIQIINDTYNANPESMKCALAMLSDNTKAGRRIAVLGDMLELGDASDKEHQEIGAFISTLNIDALFTFGKSAKRIVEYSNVHQAVSFDTQSDVVRELISFIKPNDVILFKGSRGMKMEGIMEEFRKKYERKHQPEFQI